MANCYNRFQLESGNFEYFFKQKENCVMGILFGLDCFSLPASLQFLSAMSGFDLVVGLPPV